MLPTLPIILKALCSSLFLLFGPLNEPNLFTTFSKHLRRPAGRTYDILVCSFFFYWCFLEVWWGPYWDEWSFCEVLDLSLVIRWLLWFVSSSLLILESPNTPSGLTTIIIHKIPITLHLFTPCTNFIPLYILVFFFSISVSILFLSIIYSLFSAPHHHPHTIIVFSLCPLEVYLHTYLTTWLSSCPVKIFLGFLTIIVNQKIITKE